MKFENFVALGEVLKSDSNKSCKVVNWGVNKGKAAIYGKDLAKAGLRVLMGLLGPLLF